MDEKLYQERKANGTCYFCGKTGHMISQCNARKKQEGTKGKGKGGGKPKYTSCKDVGPFEDFATWDITRYRVIVGDPPADRTRGGYMILDWILFRI